MLRVAFRRSLHWLRNAFKSPPWIRKMRGWVYSSHPQAVRSRVRYWYDAEHRERRKAYFRQYRASHAELRERKNEQAREWRKRKRASDPDWVERERARDRARYRRKRAASSGD